MEGDCKMSAVKLRCLQLINFWQDLEGSYESKGEPLGLTRSEFIKKFIAYKEDGSHNIDYLIKIVNTDMTKPECAPYMDDCTNLVNLFKHLAIYVDSNGIPDEIENLSVFLVEMLSIHDKLDKKSLDAMFFKTKKDFVEYPYSKMISQFGAVESYGTFVKDKSKSKNMVSKLFKGYELKSDNFKVLHSREYDSYLRNNYTSKDEFILNCARVVLILIQLNKVPDKIYITDVNNVKNGQLFGKDVSLIEQLEFNGFNINKYKVCDFEVYCLC